jgi:hypothetical protein
MLCETRLKLCGMNNPFAFKNRKLELQVTVASLIELVLT